MSLTGAVAPNGQQLLRALEIWRDDVNAAGGLLGRPVELIHYDDQSTPANVPAIYQKLLSVDKVDLLLGPYSTNMAAPAMPVIMQAGKTTISMLAIGVNRHFDYDRYFSMVPVRAEGVASFSKGFFELAAAQKPEAGDRRDGRRRRGVRPHRCGRRQGECARSSASRSSMTGAIRRPTRISRRSCAPSRPPMPTSCLSRPIRPTPSASSGPRMRSA